MAVLAGVVTVVLIAGFVYEAENSYNGLPFLSYRDVYLSLPNIGHLQQHDPVDIAGVHVGQVLQTTTRNDRALVELQLQGVGPLPVDSRAIVRADGLLGERYVELDLGTSHRTLPQGGTIVEGGGTYTSGIPETLNLFDAGTRTALGEMIRGFGDGVEGRGSQLNEAIHVGPASGANFDTAAYAILARPGAARNFLPYTNSGMAALNSARNQIAGMLAPTADALGPFATERSAVDAALPLTIPFEASEYDAFALDHFPRLALSLVTLAHAADPVLPEIPAALQSATRLLRDTAAPLRQTKPALNEVPHAVPAALGILGSLKPDLTPLRQDFVNLDSPVSILAEHGCDIQNAATGIRSLVNYGTSPGGNWGRDVGFPVMLAMVSPQMATSLAGGLPSYPTENRYSPPCAYSPGPTISQATMLQVLSGAIK